MANNFDKITELVNAGNQMGLSNTIKRDYGIPLDFTSVQKDYASAVEYAATNTLAYIGQTLSVGDKLYIITNDSQGKYIASDGSEIDVFLLEIGAGGTADISKGIQIQRF